MKKINFFWIILILLLGFGLGFFWSRYYHQNFKKDNYPYRVGYIYNGIELDSVKPHAHKSLKGFYHSSAPEIYKGSKYQFKERLFASFNANKYEDNGYFNLRFYISNEGKVWLYEFKEMDFDFNPTHFSPGLKEELIALSFKQENWNPYSEEDLNYYMHLTYRIENGKITEIIP